MFYDNFYHTMHHLVKIHTCNKPSGQPQTSQQSSVILLVRKVSNDSILVIIIDISHS